MLLLLLCLISLCLLLFLACRVIFLWENSSFFSDLTFSGIVRIFRGGMRFDFSAICYINAVYLLGMLFPFPFRMNGLYQTIMKWLFVVVNGIAVVSNLMDTVYFQYINRRSTISVFKEFKDDNVGGEKLLVLSFSTTGILHWPESFLFLSYGNATGKLNQLILYHTERNIISYKLFNS